MVLAFVCDSFAAVKIKNSTANRYEEQNVEYYGEEAADIETLENDIRILDEEIAKCQKQKKGWIAATVIGAAGTVATGVAAGVQGVKLKEVKGERDKKSNDLGDATEELKELKKQREKLEQLQPSQEK